MNTDRFSYVLTAADGNNIVTLLDFPRILAFYEQFKIDCIVEHAIVLEDLHCKVGLFTILEAGWENTNALASPAVIEAARAKIMQDGQKIYLQILTARENGPWVVECEEIIQNKNSLEQPWALIAPAFGTNETALLGESLKIGIRIANKAQGVGGLKGTDYLRIFGSWRKQTKIELKKKDNDIKALQDRISALETLLGTFGAPSINLPGSNGLVPAPPAGGGEFLLRGDRSWENPAKFATPAQITAAINSLIGNSSAALNTLEELGAALANDANFAATITNALNAKVSLTATETISGQKTLSAPLKITDTTPSTSTTTGALTTSSVGVSGRLSAGSGYFSSAAGVGDRTFDFTNSPIKSGIGTANQDAVFSLHCSGSGLGIFGYDFSALRFVIGSFGGKAIEFCTNVGGTPGADNLALATPVMQIIGQNVVCPVLPTSAAGLSAGTIYRSGNQLLVV